MNTSGSSAQRYAWADHAAMPGHPAVPRMQHTPGAMGGDRLGSNTVGAVEHLVERKTEDQEHAERYWEMVMEGWFSATDWLRREHWAKASQRWKWVSRSQDCLLIHVSPVCRIGRMFLLALNVAACTPRAYLVTEAPRSTPQFGSPLCSVFQSIALGSRSAGKARLHKAGGLLWWIQYHTRWNGGNVRSLRGKSSRAL